MSAEKSQTLTSPMLMCLSIGIGIGFAIVASKEIDSVLLSAGVAALISGATAFFIYRIGLWLVAPSNSSN